MFIVFQLIESSYGEVSRHSDQAEAIAACPPSGRVEFQADGVCTIVYDAPAE